VSWYAAHIIMVVEYLDGVQDAYPLWENVVAFKCDSAEEVYDLAEACANRKYSEGLDDGFRCEDRPAILKFVGVRKIMEIIGVGEGGITSEVEITSSQLEVTTEQDLRSMMNGESVQVLLD